MKRLKVILVALFVFLFISCPAAYKSDNDVFGNFDPITLQGDPDTDYFVTASRHQPCVYLWQRVEKNTENETAILIYSYNFYHGTFGDKNSRDIVLLSVAFLRGNIWICGLGSKYQFMRLNVETGKLTFLQLDCIPESVVAIPKTVDGKGTLWCASYAAPGIGIAIRQLDDDGNVIHKYNVKHRNIYVLDLDGMHFYNNTYFLFCSSYDDYTIGDIIQNRAKYNLLKLMPNEDNFEIETGLYSNAFSPDYLKLAKYNETDSFLTSFWSHNSTYYLFPAFIGFSTSLNKNMAYRFICPIEKTNGTLEVKPAILYTHDEFNEDDDIWPAYVFKNSSNLYIIGKPGYDVKYSTHKFDGFYMCVYDLSSGMLVKRYMMPEAVSFHKLLDGKAWFGKSEYTQDETTLEWKYKGIGVYCFDELTEKLYFIEKDGHKKLVEGIDVNSQ